MSVQSVGVSGEKTYTILWNHICLPQTMLSDRVKQVHVWQGFLILLCHRCGFDTACVFTPFHTPLTLVHKCVNGFVKPRLSHPTQGTAPRPAQEHGNPDDAKKPLLGNQYLPGCRETSCASTDAEHLRNFHPPTKLLFSTFLSAHF